jgi:hypothetical protein
MKISLIQSPKLMEILESSECEMLFVSLTKILQFRSFYVWSKVNSNFWGMKKILESLNFQNLCFLDWGRVDWEN